MAALVNVAENMVPRAGVLLDTGGKIQQKNEKKMRICSNPCKHGFQLGTAAEQSIGKEGLQREERGRS